MIEQECKEPNSLQVIEVMAIINGHAEQHGYDSTAAIFKIVEAYNDLWAQKDGKRRRGLGAVGFFPTGKPLNKDDQGASMALIEKREDGNVHVDLGQMCLTWFALTPELARDFARKLLQTANEPAPKPVTRLPGLPS